MAVFGIEFITGLTEWSQIYMHITVCLKISFVCVYLFPNATLTALYNCFILLTSFM